MEQILQKTLDTGSFAYLTGLVAASLFFAMAGIREIKKNCLEGLLYLALAVFFACAHAFLLFNAAAGSTIGQVESRLNLWYWLVLLLAPTLIGLFVMLGLFNFVTARIKDGLTKIFFGLALLYYLYLVGFYWPMDVKGILTLIWCGLWFNVELQTAS